MNDFLMKPKIDFAFKEIMANETARTGFLAAVLELNPESIKETVILNTFLRREHEDDSRGFWMSGSGWTMRQKLILKSNCRN